jgi:N-hydroxyarylamine O-acetyltransferase
MPAEHDRFDLSAYLARTGQPRVTGADAATLTRLHRAHLAAIPFENLDIQMGRPIELDPLSLQETLVLRRRGGYCFQQNALFRLALTSLGFTVHAREARVRFAATLPVPPRTHMVLVVPIDGVDWLVDVGFGANGIVEPLRLHGTATAQDGWMFRVEREGRLHVLQRRDGDRWLDLYAFADDDAADIDYVIGNWYTSTHPDSKFVRTLTAQRMIGDARHQLRDLSYSVARRGGEWQTRTIAREELIPLLREVFGLDVPENARFRALDVGAHRGVGPRNF